LKSLFSFTPSEKTASFVFVFFDATRKDKVTEEREKKHISNEKKTFFWEQTPTKLKKEGNFFLAN